MLLDTHILVWSVVEPRRLTAEIRTAFLTASAMLVSVATIWEIAIKSGQGRLYFPIERIESVISGAGFHLLGIAPAHAVAAGALPPHHRDPFDRMLVAQARTEDLVLVSQDGALARYDVNLLGRPA